MARQYLDYGSAYDLYDENDDKIYTIQGLAYPPDFYPYKNYFKKHIIKPEEQYRPDKIMFNLVGDQTADWALDCINDFVHGIEEYYAGREINYLERDALKLMGIL